MNFDNIIKISTFIAAVLSCILTSFQIWQYRRYIGHTLNKGVDSIKKL